MMAMKSQRAHVGIFGKRNAGKSSFINVLSGQDVAIVSDRPGTTTDPVKKTLELTGIGPVVMIDTAGIDDDSELGEQRVKKSFAVIDEVDLLIILFSHNNWGEYEERIIQEAEKRTTPFFIIHNKSDLIPLNVELAKKLKTQFKTDVIDFSTTTSSPISVVLSLIDRFLPQSVFNNPSILGDLVQYGDLVMFVTPIDIEAPQGRLILPQVQSIRDALDNDCIVVILKERDLETYWKNIGVRPKLVVTDSQAFLKVEASIPADIPLTSFSILFARLKGDFGQFIQGARQIGQLQDGDNILIFESCSHHVAQDDIGRVKIPRWLTNTTGKKLQFEIVAGLDQPRLERKEYSLVIQCGGCMMTRKQILNRLQGFENIPITNYGMCIAYCHGIFDRAIAPFQSDCYKEGSFYL